jgi:pullulanase/glycogen debranching enzyme
MSLLELELAHMLTILNSEFRDGWVDYLRDKVRRLVREDPREYGELPARLTAAMNAAKGSAGPSSMTGA